MDWNSKQNFAFLNKETAIIFLSLLRIDYLYFLRTLHNLWKKAKVCLFQVYQEESFIP